MDEVRTAVRESYARVAKEGRSGAGCGCGSSKRSSPKKNGLDSCCPVKGLFDRVRGWFASKRGGSGSCCGGGDSGRDYRRAVGYAAADIDSVPEGANMSLGCGNPLATASLKEGETVLDLGSGGGFDCFLAAKRVGSTGRVIGVDMTAEMIERARSNAEKNGCENVEFRLGEIEHLPVADASVNVVISNCVINLSTDKGSVFREAFRALKPGGRLMVSDIVLLGDKKVADLRIEEYVGCLAGALPREEYLGLIRSAGFVDVTILEEAKPPVELLADDPLVKDIVKKMGITIERLKEWAESGVASVKVQAFKRG